MNGQNQRTVLIVEDDGEVLEVYSKFFSRFRYVVTTATSLDEAKKYQGGRYNILLVDGLKGNCFKVCEMIDAEKKVIATGDEELAQESERRGGFIVERKPVELSRLIWRL